MRFAQLWLEGQLLCRLQTAVGVLRLVLIKLVFMILMLNHINAQMTVLEFDTRIPHFRMLRTGLLAAAWGMPCSSRIGRA